MLALKSLLNFEFDKELHFIPCVGANNTLLLTSLMIGWGINYCNLFDNDKQGRNARNKLLESFDENDVNIVMVSDDKKTEIEDLFTKGDFKNWILNSKETAISANEKNSEIIKKKINNFDKVLLSKLFYEKVLKGEVVLAKDTKSAFQNLLEKLNNKLFT